jgi:predicted acetyltransferase
MVDLQEVALAVATPRDEERLSNLLELYIHDLSEIFPVELGADGRFGYAKLPLYWSEPERRFPFLILCGSRVVGFALVTRGSPASDDPEVLDIAEFFVVRRYRRCGVGRRAAFLLWNRLAGSWTVRVSEANRGGRRFWTSAVTEYTSGTATETTRPGNPHAWRVFSFDSVDRSHSRPL